MSKRIVIRRGVLPRPEAKPVAATPAYTMAFGTLHALDRFFLRGEEYVKVGEEAMVSLAQWNAGARRYTLWLPIRSTTIVQVDRDMPKVQL